MYILAVLILSYARHKKWTYDLKTFSYSKRASSLTHIINSFTFKKSVYTSIVTIKKDEVVMGQNYLDMGGRKESEVALSVFGGTLKDDLPQDSPPSAAAAPRSLGPPRGRSSLAPAAPVQAQQRRVDPHGRVLGVFPAQDQKRVPKADYKGSLLWASRRMSSRYQKAFTIPEGFPAILKSFTREVRTGQSHATSTGGVRVQPDGTLRGGGALDECCCSRPPSRRGEANVPKKEENPDMLHSSADQQLLRRNAVSKRILLASAPLGACACRGRRKPRV